MIIAIGNSPSSGSTYLADLVDSLPFAVCGPELHLFSSRRHFDDYEGIRQRGFGRASTPCLYAPYSVHLAKRHFPEYGVSAKDVHGFLAEEVTFSGFCRRFLCQYAASRGKRARLFFEKTPENIHTAARFLECFPDGIFLHIVRDPRYVYRSLRKRGGPFSISAATWLIDVASVLGLRDHPRFYTLHYEDLVRDPERSLNQFLAFIGEKESADSLREHYQRNEHRLKLQRAESWSMSGYGRFGDANEQRLTEQELDPLIRYLTRLKVGSRYSRLFGVPEKTFDEVARHFGYSVAGAPPESREAGIAVDHGSKRWLARKWMRDFVSRAARPADLRTYLSPVEFH